MVFQGPIASRLIPTLGAAYGLQVALAAIFVPLQTEKFYDLSGSVGFMTTAFVSLYTPYLRNRFWLGKNVPFPGLGTHAPRQLLLTGALVLWAGRLGSFLIARIFKDGKDSRFDKIKTSPLRFFGAWVAQATWISLVGLPVYLANAVPAKSQRPLGPRDYVGLALFGSSFLFEVIADRQKSAWRQEKDEKKHDEAFISRGLWSISRHPNYVGEVGLWTGIAVVASSAMISPALPPWMRLTPFIGPAWTYFQLTKISGVTLLERSGDKKFGSDPKYQEYKRNTPVFFPWGPKGDA